MLAARTRSCDDLRLGARVVLDTDNKTGKPMTQDLRRDDGLFVTEHDRTDERMRRLRPFNLVMGAFHLAQALVIVVLTTDFALPVTAAYLAGPPGSGVGDPVTLFSIPLGVGVAAFLAISAVAHGIIGGPAYSWYVASVGQGRNPGRWIEYSLSSSLMVVLIAQITGISDVAALLSILGLNASMILFGWLQELYERPGGGGWLPFGFGCFAGIVPWVAIAIYVVSPANPSEASAPGFVYGIIASLFVFFNVFGLNQWLQYRRVGRWRDYLYGEYVYIVLSLAAKSLLAWLVFANTLVPS